ncbi:adenylate cyclase type 10-like isoform X3 [Atheta coriaria]|uniref:adenylate cyclase type 10-like isoform X3 n=1 Tax=Dalotia coriaria TaxID=877792 RepID=UPI0031F39154
MSQFVGGFLRSVFKLNIKMMITSGNIDTICCGSDKKSLLFRGEPFEELDQLSSVVKAGEILISTKAWAHMIHNRYKVTVINESMIKLLEGKIPHKAAQRDVNESFDIKEVEVLQLIDKHLEFLKTMHNHRQTDSIETLTTLTNMFVKEIPPREAIGNAMRFEDFYRISPFVFRRVQKHISEHQPVEYLTEITTVTAQIITIIPNSFKSMSSAFVKFVYTEVNKSIEGTHGFIYMFEVTTEIKIIVMSGIEGIRQDMECNRALKTGYKMSQQFQNTPGVNYISVGIFQGYLYCGVVGHPFRRDYVAIGSVLNKGFKILQRSKGKVICDYKTFKFSKLSAFMFRCIRKRKCNVDFDNGQLMEYDESIDYMEYKSIHEKDLFEKDAEVNLILQILQSNASASQGIVFEGCQMIGKTTLLRFVKSRCSDSENFHVVSLTIRNGTSTPYSTIFRIYEQLYSLKSATYEDMNQFFKLPTQLANWHNNSYNNNEDSMSKCNILKHFQNMLLFEDNRAQVIILKNLHYIDNQSWEILEIVLKSCRLKLFASSEFSSGNHNFKKTLEKNPYVKLITLKPISDESINTLACTLLGVVAIEKKISALVTSTCLGLPGYVQSCLKYLLDCKNYQIAYISKNELESNYVIIHKDLFPTLQNPIAVLTIRIDKKSGEDIRDKCTIEAITKEVYYSLPPFEQTILRTSSVLGTFFTRDMLSIALRSPSEKVLVQGIKIMFTEGIFECGCTTFDDDKFCCRCHMSKEEMAKIQPNEKYTHCKLLHLKHIDIKNIAYSMIPENQKKDLHLLCTDVLENTAHFCPTCLRDPVNSFIVAAKYKDILTYCADSSIAVTSCRAKSSEGIKQCIRRLVYDACQCHKTNTCKYVLPLRQAFNPLRCNCFEMLLYVFKNLIYHSRSAKHLGKHIFYSSIYGYLLVITHNAVEGIAVLREAYELCMVNVNLEKCEISANYRKFSIGRISMMLATALIKLRKINQAKLHITLAMRQYNIPSVAFKYNNFQCLLKKSYLVNMKGRNRVIIKQTWMRWEVGMCFIICARIFSIEGKLPIARKCARYSTWVLSQINERIPMLFEAYCNVIDLYRYGLDKEVCEKLQKYVTKELLLNYCNDRGYYAKHLMTLLVVDFELKVSSGQLKKSISMCYRIVDFTLRFYVDSSNYEVVIWFSLLFTYTLRFKQFIDIMRVIYKNAMDASPECFFSNALGITILTGYSYVPIRSLVKEIVIYLNYEQTRHTCWTKHYLSSLLYLHLMKSELYQGAEKYKPKCTLNLNVLRRPIVMRIQLNIIEGELIEMYSKMEDNSSYTSLKTSLKKQIDMASKCIKHMPIFYPKLYCLKAWKYQLEGRAKKAEKELRKAEKISIEQGNVYYQCLVRKVRNYWSGSHHLYISSYKKRLNVELEDIKYFSESQWAQVLLPYPIIKI